MSEYTVDELEAPSWMNDEFFQQVLKASEKDNSISVTDVNITPATLKGDHFASIMFRGVVKYDTHSSKGSTKSMIIKSMPEADGPKLEMVANSHVFETEIGMYFEVVPKLEAELRKIGDDTVLGARALYCSLKPRKLIIFEDVVPMGYATLRGRTANMEETKVAYLKLAKWHAASYKLIAEGDESMTKYHDGLMNMKGFVENQLASNGMNNFIDKLSTVEDLKKYVPKLRKMEKDFVKRCVENTSRQKEADGIFALMHGDFHSRNMMFKWNDKGAAEDVILVDFQISFYGSVIMDVLYGIYMLLDGDLRRNHRDEIIHYYATNFIETLKKMKFKGKIPKIREFFIEALRSSYWDLFLLSTFLPLWYAATEKKLEDDEMMNCNEARRLTYDDERYINDVRRILPTMFHQGYLELD